MASNSLTDLFHYQDELVDQTSKESKSLTDLTLNDSKTNSEIESAKEDEYFELELKRSIADLDKELLTLLISRIERKMSDINSEILELESELKSTTTCLAALDYSPLSNS